MDPANKQARMIVLWTFCEHVCRTIAQFGHEHPKTIKSKERLRAIFDLLLASEGLERLRVKEAAKFQHNRCGGNATTAGSHDTDGVCKHVPLSVAPQDSQHSTELDGSPMDLDECSNASQSTQGNLPENTSPSAERNRYLFKTLLGNASICFTPFSTAQDLVDMISSWEEASPEVRIWFQDWIADNHQNSVLVCPQDWPNNIYKERIISSGPAILSIMSITVPPWLN